MFDADVCPLKLKVKFETTPGTSIALQAGTVQA